MNDILLLLLSLGIINSIILYIWFKTDAFVEYTRLFGLGSLFHIDEYIDISKDDTGRSYPSYLVANYNSFFTRLIGCPACLCFWLSLFINAPIFFIALFLNILSIVLMPAAVLITMFFGLACYGILIKLTKNE